MTKAFIKESLLEIRNDLAAGNIEKAKIAVNGMLLLASSVKPTKKAIKWAEGVIERYEKEKLNPNSST